MRSVLAGTLLVAALALAGCGGGSSPSNGEAGKTADRVLSDAMTAADAARSVHMSSQFSTLTQHIDLTFVTGKGATGSITQYGHTLRVIVVGHEAYMNADAAFYRQTLRAPARAAALLAGQWLKLPTFNPLFASLRSVVAFGTYIGSFPQPPGPSRIDGARTYNGQSVVAIADSTDVNTLYVSATGTAYPVALVRSTSGGLAGGTITFDSWNKAVTLRPPSGAIDISGLVGG